MISVGQIVLRASSSQVSCRYDQSCGRVVFVAVHFPPVKVCALRTDRSRNQFHRVLNVGGL